MSKVLASYIFSTFVAGAIILGTFAFVVIIKSIEIVKAQDKEEKQKLERIEKLKKLGFKDINNK